MDYFYHYTSRRKLEQIFSGEARGKKGLIPIRRAIPVTSSQKLGIPEKMENGVIFGLTEKMPPAWMQHDYGSLGIGTFEVVLNNVAGKRDEVYLLKCYVTRKTDVFVMDRSYHNDPAFDWVISNPVTARVKQDFWKSRIRLQDYKGEYPMGEVLCFDPIPLKQLEVVQYYKICWKLINEFRACAGREPLPPLPRLNPKRAQKIFNSLFASEPS